MVYHGHFDSLHVDTMPIYEREAYYKRLCNVKAEERGEAPPFLII